MVDFSARSSLEVEEKSLFLPSLECLAVLKSTFEIEFSLVLLLLRSENSSQVLETYLFLERFIWRSLLWLREELWYFRYSYFLGRLEPAFFIGTSFRYTFRVV